MSQIYYCGEGPENFSGQRHPQAREEKADSDVYRLSGKSHLRLHEIEEQLQMAENRCNTLKGQLEQMKSVYEKNKKTKQSKKFKRATPSSNFATCDYVSPVFTNNSNGYSNNASAPMLEPSKEISTCLPHRQSSHAISTDTTGAAVLTINHILSGITDSVNRLSELHSHLGIDKKYSAHPRKYIPNNPSSRKTAMQGTEEEVQIPEKLTSTSCKRVQETADKSSNVSMLEELPLKEPAVKIRSKHNTKKTSKRSSRGGTANSNPWHSSEHGRRSVNVTARHVDKTMQLNSVKTSPVLDRSTSTICCRKRKLKRLQPSSSKTIAKKPSICDSNKRNTEKLIELYHNVSIKESDSGESNAVNAKSNTKMQNKYNINLAVPPLSMHQASRGDANAVVQEDPCLSPIQEADYNEPVVARNAIECNDLSRSYELPTIASRMKQVAKCYMNTFNFSAIPFCAAKSITPSHNIGINIQQVMSIMKARHPVNGISPTLAHNIGLAAEKLNSKPLHALMSSLSSRIIFSKQCPLTRSTVNYQQLQEMAKDVPDGDDTPKYRNYAGDKAISEIKVTENRTKMIWSRNPMSQSHCTCVPSQGISFHQVLDKYGRYSNGVVNNYHQAQLQHHGPAAVLASKFAVPSKFAVIPRNAKSKTINQKESSSNSTEKRRKSLKVVLQNLHDDFETLNKKYEELKASCSSSEKDEVAVKELEKMEVELNNKEEEINMVLTLYKEITALKEQVQILKKKASQTSVATKPPGKMLFTEPQTAIHLSKLLREVQNFQQHFKVKGNGLKK